MTTYNAVPDKSSAASLNVNGLNESGLFKAIIDFAAIPLTDAGNVQSIGEVTMAGAMTSSDTLKLFWVPNGTLVRNVTAYVKTAMTDGTNPVMVIGDGSDADGWITSVPLDAVAVIKADGAYLFGTDADVTGAFINKVGKMYTADTYLQGTFTGTPAANGVVHVLVEAFRIYTA